MLIDALRPNPLDQIGNPNTRAVMLAREVRSGSVENLGNLTASLATEVYAEAPERSPMAFYRRYAQLVDFRIPKAVSDSLISDISSEDPDTSVNAKRTLLFLRMRSAVAVIDSFSNGEEELDVEVLHAGIDNYFQNAADYTDQNNWMVPNLIQKGAMRFIADREGMPLGWIRSGKYLNIKETVLSGIQSQYSREELVMEIVEAFGEQKDEVEKYIDKLIASSRGLQDADGGEHKPMGDLSTEREIDIAHAIGGLRDNEQQVIIARFGFNGAEFMTLADLSKKLNVTSERVRQIEGRALRKLRFRVRNPIDYNLNSGEHVYLTSEIQREIQLERARERRRAILRTVGIGSAEVQLRDGDLDLEDLLSGRPIEDRTWYTLGVPPESWRRPLGVAVLGLNEADLEEGADRSKLFELIVGLQRGKDHTRILLHVSDKSIIDELSEHLREANPGSYYYRDNRYVKEEVQAVIDDQLSLDKVREVYLKLLSKGYNPTVVTSLQNALELVSSVTLAQIREKVVSDQRYHHP